MIKIKQEDWFAKGEELFGKDIRNWKFVCPMCKTVQTPQELLDLGISDEEARGLTAFSCIGRFTKDKGCDWTLGGLFQIHEMEVILSDGMSHPVFEFAIESQEVQAA